MNPAPGFKKRPEYRIAVKPSGARVQVLLNGEVRSPLQTYCPFKGDAAYYSFRNGAQKRGLELRAPL